MLQFRCRVFNAAHRVYFHADRVYRLGDRFYGKSIIVKNVAHELCIDTDSHGL